MLSEYLVSFQNHDGNESSNTDIKMGTSLQLAMGALSATVQIGLPVCSKNSPGHPCFQMLIKNQNKLKLKTTRKFPSLKRESLRSSNKLGTWTDMPLRIWDFQGITHQSLGCPGAEECIQTNLSWKWEFKKTRDQKGFVLFRCC